MTRFDFYIKKNYRQYLSIFLISIAFSSLNGCGEVSINKNQEYVGYLFPYFIGNAPGEEAIRYAISTDGYNFKALNNNKAIIDSNKISSRGGVRDPHILRGDDGKTFYMTVTDLYVPNDGWSNHAMILMKSEDLINWTSNIINIPETFPKEFGDIKRVWAPQTIFDTEKNQYMVYWSMLGDNGSDIIYYAYVNDDFTALTTIPKQLYFSPTNSACIDGDIIFHNGQYHLFFKSESDGGIKQAVSNKLTEGYVQLDGNMDQTDEAVEGSSVFKLIDSDKYILMYDMYMTGKYQFTESTDLINFSVIDEDISMDFHPRHGTVLPVTAKEMSALKAKWGQAFNSADKLSIQSKSILVKHNNVAIDDVNKTIYLPVKNDTNLASFDPKLTFLSANNLNVKGEVTPKGPQDFSRSNVNYFIDFGDEKISYSVKVQVNNNPVLDGYYADPEIIYSNKTKKYHLYPTSDGFDGWSGTYFKSFSSSDLITWQDDGVILDLKKDVSWTSRNAWAPTIIEKKRTDAEPSSESEYSYYYYFTAAQKIGVAVANHPSGPFVDSGAPLISSKPAGITHGQEIDPDVFRDPVSGKSYLYWGNGYLAVVELNEDMISIKQETIKVLTPDATFREGVEVFFRDGTYYFMWSENDTRHEDYRVRYATASAPMGPLTIPENNLILSKNVEKKIYATGHNSVVKAANSDQWYIVYHRFTRPHGITMERAAGFNREISIDKLTFSDKGEVEKVELTLIGITSENYKFK
ncbi:MAG: family 43 glycosylhydrolase [Colwellia sp.]